MRPVTHVWLTTVIAPAALVLLPGCRDDSSPTAPDPAPAIATTTSQPLVFRQVTAGRDFSCGVTTDDVAYCWGANYYGALGNGTTDLSPLPVAVSGGHRFRQVEAGNEHACGVTIDDRAYCWGRNRFGQLGNGKIVDQPAPVAVAGGLRFREVSAGDQHTCGVTTSDRAYCWGYAYYGQLGDGSAVNKQKRPARVNIGRRFRQVSAGGRHSCGVTTDDRAFCWGDGSDGAIGDGKTFTRRTPRAVAGGLSFQQVIVDGQSTSGGYSCGVTIDDRAYCWGGNFAGRLGDGTMTDRLKPVPVAGGIRFSAVNLGEAHTCGVSTDNAAYCWGNGDSGQVGDGGPLGTNRYPSPFPVVGGLQFASVAASHAHTCGVTVDGAGYCWGDNSAGELGTGTQSSAISTPGAVVGPS